MNLYRVTFHAEILIEAINEGEAMGELQINYDIADLQPIFALIGDADALRAEIAESSR